MKRFTITITNYNWSCGDGCCSDSGYKVRVIDNSPEKRGYNVVYDNDDWDNNRNHETLLDQSIEQIEDKHWLGRAATIEDYEVIYDGECNDEEQND
jgi:hypothetical protein